MDQQTIREQSEALGEHSGLLLCVTRTNVDTMEWGEILVCSLFFCVIK